MKSQFVKVTKLAVDTIIDHRAYIWVSADRTNIDLDKYRNSMKEEFYKTTASSSSVSFRFNNGVPSTSGAKVDDVLSTSGAKVDDVPSTSPGMVDDEEYLEEGIPSDFEIDDDEITDKSDGSSDEEKEDFFIQEYPGGVYSSLSYLLYNI